MDLHLQNYADYGDGDHYHPNKTVWCQRFESMFLTLMLFRFAKEGASCEEMEAKMAAYLYLAQKSDCREGAIILMDIAKAKAFQQLCVITEVNGSEENWLKYSAVYDDLNHELFVKHCQNIGTETPAMVTGYD